MTYCQRLHSLQKLNISYDKIEDEGLKSLHFLVKLNLSHCSGITGIANFISLSLSLAYLYR